MKSNRLTTLAIVAGVMLLVALVAARSMLYVVDTRELAVVLRFGNPVREDTQPGLGWKLPFIEQVRILPSTRQFWGDHVDFVLPDLPTKDDKKIEVIPWAIWRIQDPTVFVQRMRTMDNAVQRVAQFTRGAIRDVITQYDLAELVRSSDRVLDTTADNVGQETSPPQDEEGTRRVRMNIQIGRLAILEKIKQEAQRRLADTGVGGEGTQRGRGIELVDLGISHIEFVASVREKTFDRWIAQRQAISTRNVNEGERLKQQIINRAEADVQRIQGEGQQKANEIRGKVDAEIIQKYASAIETVGDFYTFARTLEAYEKAIDGNTRLILTTDNRFLKLFRDYKRELSDAPPAEE